MTTNKTIGKKVQRDGKAFIQTLEGHIVDSLKIYKSYLKNNERVLEQFSNRWELGYNKFLNSLFYTIHLHDLGKLCSEFQENIKKGKYSPVYPHALYSYQLTKDIDHPEISDVVPLERLVILGHHTQLHKDIYGPHTTNIREPYLLKPEIEEFVSKAEQIYYGLKFDNFFSLQPIGTTEIKSCGRQSRRKTERELKNYKRKFFENKVRLKSIFSLLFSILQTADDYSSANFSREVKRGTVERKISGSILTASKSKSYTPTLSVEEPFEKILEGYDPYPFQRRLFDRCPKYSTLFAPCGRGKTEAALLWAVKALQKFDRNKIIFAMPTQVTSNAMWERLCKLFGEGEKKEERFEDGKRYVGLFHGKSFLKQKKELENEEKREEFARVRAGKENFKGNIFFKPVTITTIDHLIFSSVHGFKQADFAFGNLQNSVMVFDEAHYYDKHTLQHLITFFQLLSDLDVPHLLMTGTLPDFLKEKIDEFNEYKEIEDEEGLQYTPFKIKKREKFLVKDGEVPQETENEIIDKLEQGFNQFIILNTVERSKVFYDKIKISLPEKYQDNLILYHSRFTHNDRLKKEQEIGDKDKAENPLLLIATQVIEISLDISADLMYTEIAPSDAIGQRAGRLHRGAGDYKNNIEHRLEVFLAENHYPYPEEIFESSSEKIDDFEKGCSYQDIKEFCDQVYTNYDIRAPTDLYYPNNLSEIQSFFEQAVLFGPPYYKIAYENEEGKALEIRRSEVRKIDVIPYCIYCEEGEKAFKTENMVQIPYYEYKKNPDYFTMHEKEEEEYILCKYPYTYEKGFDRKTQQETSDRAFI